MNQHAVPGAANSAASSVIGNKNASKVDGPDYVAVVLVSASTTRGAPCCQCGR